MTEKIFDKSGWEVLFKDYNSKIKTIIQISLNREEMVILVEEESKDQKTRKALAVAKDINVAMLTATAIYQEWKGIESQSFDFYSAMKNFLD